MNRIDPALLFGLFLLAGFVHLVCAAAVGATALRRGPGPGWPLLRMGLRSNSAAGMGLAIVAGVVAWRVSPSRVSAADSWIMVLGLLLAVGGQGGMIHAMRAGGALSAPALGERRPRLYIGAAPLAVLLLLALLFLLRGVR